MGKMVAARKEDNTVSEPGVGIDISIFLGTVSLFFVGILMSKLGELNSQIRVGIVFLVVATFSFIFSAIIFANTIGAHRKGGSNTQRHLKVGNALSEFMGLYIFVLAIPLVVNSLTEDSFMRHSVLIIAILSLTLYTLSPYSIADRVLSRRGKLFYSTLVLLFASVLTVGQVYVSSIFLPVAILVLLFFASSALLFAENT